MGGTEGSEKLILNSKARTSCQTQDLCWEGSLERSVRGGPEGCLSGPAWKMSQDGDPTPSRHPVPTVEYLQGEIFFLISNQKFLYRNLCLFPCVLLPRFSLGLLFLMAKFNK